MKRITVDSEIAGSYIRENFEAGDRLAVVLLNKRTGEVIQRLAAAEKIAAPDFQAWLRQKNADRFEVYLSMNVLKEGAESRTKADVGVIRHVFLDFDENGTAAVEELLKRDDLPKPNYVVSTSPGKWQVLWRVEGFTAEQAEHLQKGLSRETGADIAATDCSRVLRLPGFYNHKYARRHFVSVETLSGDIYSAERFPSVSAEEHGARGMATRRGVLRNGSPSQSEKDWAFAKRALTRGESPEAIIAAISMYRRYDKHNPKYYAELTVQKAAASLATDRSHATVRTEEPNR